VSESGGCIDIVTDEEILAAQAWLAANEGIFVEPASAASIAGLFKSLDPASGRAFEAVRGLGMSLCTGLTRRAPLAARPMNI
jgi:threonine synthase